MSESHGHEAENHHNNEEEWEIIRPFKFHDNAIASQSCAPHSRGAVTRRKKGPASQGQTEARQGCGYMSKSHTMAYAVRAVSPYDYLYVATPNANGRQGAAKEKPRARRG